MPAKAKGGSGPAQPQLAGSEPAPLQLAFGETAALTPRARRCPAAEERDAHPRWMRARRTLLALQNEIEASKRGDAQQQNIYRQELALKRLLALDPQQGLEGLQGSLSLPFIFEELFGTRAPDTSLSADASAAARDKWALEHGFIWTDVNIVGSRSRSRSSLRHEASTCDCMLQGLTNKHLYIECMAVEGGVEGCDNMRLQMLRDAPQHGVPLKIFDTQTPKGLGVLAERDVQEGELLVEYVGEVHERRQPRRGVYLLQIGGLRIDAKTYGNQSRFFNHSCNPNCRVESWQVPEPGSLHTKEAVAIFASEFIKKGTELTYDYNFTPGEAAIACNCNAPGCRGVLSKKNSVCKKRPRC